MPTTPRTTRQGGTNTKPDSDRRTYAEHDGCVGSEEPIWTGERGRREPRMSRLRASKYAGYGLATVGAVLALAYLLIHMAFKSLVGFSDALDIDFGDELD